MSATIIDGKAVAARVRADVAAGVEAFVAETGRPPNLATVLVGDDPASQIYIANKHKAAIQVGLASTDHRLSADTSREELVALLTELGADPDVSGILLQLPLPVHLDPGEMVDLIPAAKDVDGLNVVSSGLLVQGRPGLRPCTPQGVIELLDAYDVELEGAGVVVAGRSLLVGKPVAQLLLGRNATVTTAHSEDGIAGDVDFEAARERAAFITPVPGGVGPMTIACLLRNTLAAAQAQRVTAAPSGA